jgi:DNA-binding transcriptional MerR regulator
MATTPTTAAPDPLTPHTQEDRSREARAPGAGRLGDAGRTADARDKRASPDFGGASVPPIDPRFDQRELERQPALAAQGAQRPKAITIGAVCKAISQEFPDISISKIRYLEDQKLLAPRRTPGGYRLYTQGDVARLRTILRMQRDEFLPLRVIRQELAAGRGGEAQGAGEELEAQPGRANARPRRASVSVRDGGGALYSLEEVLEETQADAKLVRELEEYGVVKGEQRGGQRYYDETEREIVGAVSELARYGVGGRNLRVLRTSADREANLLQQILAPALRSRNPQRRKEALEALENLAAVTTHLRHLLLVRDLRKIAS